MATYASTSPWKKTTQVNGYLDRITPFYFTADTSDILYQIDSAFNFRPDRLSASVYDTPKLWWVFASRNPSVLKDPIFDFVAGNIIYIPTYQQVKKVLGI